MLVIPFGRSYATNNINVTRIKGNDRYETAVEVSRETFSKSEYVIIASGENYPDALVGGTLAVQLKAPILLSSKDSISSKVLDEITRLGSKKVILLGGEASVSNKVVRELTSLPATVRRLGGKNRYETVELINRLRLTMRPDPTTQAMGDDVYYASGTNYPDALAVAPLLGQAKPSYNGILSYLLLARPGEDAMPFIAIGGPSAVKHSYDTKKPDYINYDYRIAGKNRYSTAVEIAKKYPDPEYLNKRIDTVILVSGTNFPDALSSAPLTGSLNACTLLTTSNKLPKETREYLKNNNIKRVILVGGENAITNNVYAELKGI